MLRFIMTTMLVFAFLIAGAVGIAPDVAASRGDAGADAEAKAAASAGDPGAMSEAAALEITDPLFQLIIGIIESDTVGVWTQDDVQTYLEATNRTSMLPVEYIQRIERWQVAATEAESRRGARVVNAWRLVLTESLNLPMPYSILGYNPGSLIVSQEVTFSEWYLGNPNLHVAFEGEVTIYPAQGLKTLRIDTGWIILDVDGWLDKLLGGRVDDAWTQGFSVGRVEGELYGISLGVNPKGRPLYGDFDFLNNSIYSDVRPLTRSLHFYARPWVEPPEGMPSYAWQYEK